MGECGSALARSCFGVCCSRKGENWGCLSVECGWLQPSVDEQGSVGGWAPAEVGSVGLHPSKTQNSVSPWLALALRHTQVLQETNLSSVD